MADDDGSSSSTPALGIDAITAALVGAFRSKSVDVDDDGVSVRDTDSDGLYHLAVRPRMRSPGCLRFQTSHLPQFVTA